MLILETLGVTLFASIISALAMLIWMAIRADKYFDKRNERYYKVTMGNPLNAVFFRDLLTEEGLQQRALIGKVLAAIWVGFFVAALIESQFIS